MKREPLNSQSTNYNSREQQLYILQIFKENKFDQQQIVEKAIFLTNFPHKYLINAIEAHQVDNQIHVMFDFVENLLVNKFQHLSLARLNLILKQVKQLTDYFASLGIVTELELANIMLNQQDQLKYFMGLDFQLIENTDKFQLMEYYKSEICLMIKPLFENAKAYISFIDPQTNFNLSSKMMQNQGSVRTQKKSYSNISKIRSIKNLNYEINLNQRSNESTILQNEVQNKNLVRLELQNKYSCAGTKISCVLPSQFRRQKKQQSKICNSQTNLEGQCQARRKQYLKQFSSILFDDENPQQIPANEIKNEQKYKCEDNQIILFERPSEINTKYSARQILFSQVYSDAEWLQCEAKKSIQKSSQVLQNFQRLSLSFSI